MSFYETSENLVKKLLDNGQNGLINVKVENCNSLDYREKQIRFAYGLVNLKQWETLKKVLERLKQYEKLLNFEKKFLGYVSQNLYAENEFLSEIFVKDFIFVFEIIILDICTQIIQLEEEQVTEFLENLICDKKYLTVENLCRNEVIKLKFRNLVFELYNFSFCNRNLLKFVNLFK